MLRKGMVLTKEAFLNHLYGGMDEPDHRRVHLQAQEELAGADNLITTV